MKSGVLLAALAGALCIGAAADPVERLADPAKEARAHAIFSQIRCVVCQNQSIDESEADVARDLRQAVRRQVAAGQTDAQVKAFLVQRYGEFILLKPRFSAGNAVLWLTPFVIVLAGGVLLLLRARSTLSDGDDLTADEEARLSQLKDV